jgi:hypothetical protein
LSPSLVRRLSEVLNISVANFKRAGTARRFGWWFRRDFLHLPLA